MAQAEIEVEKEVAEKEEAEMEAEKDVAENEEEVVEKEVQVEEAKKDVAETATQNISNCPDRQKYAVMELVSLSTDGG